MAENKISELEIVNEMTKEMDEAIEYLKQVGDGYYAYSIKVLEAQKDRANRIFNNAEG